MRTTNLPHPTDLPGANGRSCSGPATAPSDAERMSDPAGPGEPSPADDAAGPLVPRRRINPLALTLGLGVVLAGGYVMSTIADPQLQLMRAPQNQQTFNVAEAPPPPETISMEPRMVAPPPVGLSRVGPVPDGPDISVTAAPGVAFNYRYAVRLPAERIAEVQELHAAACERLGVDRCRITGLRYRVVGEQGVEAMLALALDPGLARRFGKAGVEVAARADGQLVDAEISGVDADRAIRSAGRNLARLREDLARVERRLALRITAEEQLRLEDQVERLRQAIRAAESGREAQQESLTTTPLVFQYGSGEAITEATPPSLGDASRRALDTFVEGMAILGIIGVTLLPWILLALALWGLWRLVRRAGARLAPGAAADPT